MNKKTLSIIGLLVVAVLCLIRYVFFDIFAGHSDTMQENCRDHINEAAFNTLADSLEYVTTKIEIFEFDDLDTNLENVPKREIISQLSRFKNSFSYVSSVYLALENGQYYETSTLGTNQLGIENQEWYYLTRTNLKTNFLTATKSNKTVCGIIATPFYYNGEYSGVIAVELDNILFKKTAEYYGDSLAQLVISDEHGTPFYLYDKNFVESDKYLKSTSSYCFMPHNVKELSKFNVTIYLLKTNKQTLFLILNWICSALFISIMLVAIYKKWKNYKEFTVGIFAIQILLVMIIEILVNAFYFFDFYNKHVENHKTVIEKYIEQVDSNAKYLSDVIGTKVQEDRIFKENKLLETNSPEMNKLMNLYEKVSKANRHCINFFFISKDGVYQNYPINPNYAAKDLNFQINRRLLNGSDRNTYTTSVDMDTWELKEYVFKIKDDRNNYIGTFGINLKYDIPENTLARYFDTNDFDRYIEYRDGTINEITADGERQISDIKISQKQNEILNTEEYGIIRSSSSGISNHYAFFSTLRGDSKRLVHIAIDVQEKVRALFLVGLAANIIGFISAIFLTYVEKIDSVTYENVEEKYELALIKNEKKYFEMMKEKEEIDEGLRVMKIFGKKPSNLFANKLKKIREKNKLK